MDESSRVADTRYGDSNLYAELQYHLALDAVVAGEPDVARRHLATAWERYRQLDHRDGLARCFAAAAVIASRGGRTVEPASFGVARRIRTAIELEL